jgi:exodeoxyribonuclease V gamma subunit
MCPDVEDYAPLITAVFGAVDAQHAADAHPGHRLRVQLADRSLRQTNPLLDLIARLLALAGGRLTASEVLDLAACPPVRRRFGFTDDDLERLADWVATAGVRWGLDACHREPFELGALAQNTWRAGLDRILLGAAMAEDRLRWIGVTLPLDDVASTDIDLAGRLAELVDRLGGVLDRLTGSHPLSHWLDTLTGALDLLGGVADAEAWQSAQARRELAEAQVDAADHADALLLTVGDVQALLADRLAGRPTRANFRAGTLTVCSMVPMRSVPHRAVCLLGLDDGVFPRDAGTDGDDVLARDPCIGERDPKSEDRQLLLDAVLAAREHLVVCYTGADPRTNTARPPAVPVTEILDAVDSLATTADGRPAREQVVVHHPLQPFDARNFTYGDLGAVDRSFSFDRVAWRGAERAALPREEPAAFLPRPLPDADQYGDVDLGDLARWVEHPCRGFLRQRLAVSLPGDDEQIDDSLAVALDGLARWRVGDRLLADHLAGASAEDCRQAEWRRGTLPPGELGRRELDRTIAEVEPITAAAAPLLTAGSEAVDVVAGVHDRRVVGTVPGVHGDCVVRAVFSRLSAQHRLRAWVQLLALAVSEPDVSWTAVTVGRGAGDGDVARSALGPVDAEQARRSIAALVGLRDRGLCMPLPIPAKTSAAYAAARRSGMSVANAAVKAEQVWQERYPENAEPEHVLVWGENAALDRLRSSPADGAGGDEETLFGQLARQLWQPLLDAETLESP